MKVRPRPCAVEEVDERLDRRRVRRVVRLRASGRPVERPRGRRGRGDRLHVGRVAAGAAHERVLAGLGDGEELLRCRPAHRPRGRGDDHVPEPDPVEDLHVGVAVQPVGLGEPLVGEVERVRVLHEELAAAQDARPRPRLVPVLRLDLVEDHRVVLVGGVLALDELGEQLLVRGAEQVVAALAVLEPEDVGPVLGPAAGGLVGLAGQQRGQVDLLGADGVHLRAHDVLDAAQHLQAQRQPRVDPRGDAADVTGADEQLVARYLRVGRVVAEGAQEQRRHPGEHPEKGSGSASSARAEARSRAPLRRGGAG